MRKRVPLSINEDGKMNIPVSMDEEEGSTGTKRGLLYINAKKESERKMNTFFFSGDHQI